MRTHALQGVYGQCLGLQMFFSCFILFQAFRMRRYVLYYASKMPIQPCLRNAK